MAKQASADQVKTVRTCATVIVTIDCEARRNALTETVAAGIGAALVAAEADRSVRTVVLTGADNKSDIPVSLSLGGSAFAVAPHLPQAERPARPAAPPVRAETSTIVGRTATVPLIALALAHSRSGDRGDTCDIGALTRDPAFVPVLRDALTPDGVGRYLPHLLKGEVACFKWPGLEEFNFLLHRALGGGRVALLRHDPQGNAPAQILMDCDVAVPAAWLKPGVALAGFSRDVGMGTA